MVKEEVVKRSLILIVIAVLAILSFFIAKPFIMLVIASLILAYIFRPAHVRLAKLVRSTNLSAGLISFTIILIMLLFAWFLLPVLIRQTFGIYTSLQNLDFVSYVRAISPDLLASDEQLTRDFVVTSNGIILRAINSLMGRFEGYLTNLPMTMFQFLVMLFLFFFALRDYDIVINNLKELSPFNEATEKKLIVKFNDVTKAIIYGSVGGGIIQGLVTGVGLYLFGAPQVILLTVLAILFGVLPIIGTWGVWVPVSIAMIVSGNTNAAIGFAIYSTVFGIAVDFFIRPIIAKRAGISVPVTLVGMLGGGYLFGIVGLIIGPLIISYLIIMLEFYRKKTLHELFD